MLLAPQKRLKVLRGKKIYEFYHVIGYARTLVDWDKSLDDPGVFRLS